MADQGELFPIPAGSEPAAPLATRMRPRTFEQLVGQRQVVDVLRQLDREELKQVVERGLQELHATIDGDAMDALLEVAGGDARVALNGLEAAAALAGEAAIGLEQVEGALQQRHLLYDRAGDQHYDIVSALIKSVRGSDPDAAVYWMARMLEAGEDVMFVARRLVILAAEDVG